MWPAIFCIYANFATDQVSAIGDVAYDLKWYNCPLKMQKFIILIIARSQYPAKFTGLGLCDCSLEIFGKVSIFS